VSPCHRGASEQPRRSATPYDGDARWGAKKDLTWLGYKLHISETCDDPPACGRPADPAAAGRCGHDVAPNLVTGVATTPASIADAEMTLPVSAALAGRGLDPGRHYLDGGYASARAVLDAARQFGVTLITPLRTDSSRQARAGQGYDRTAFAIDYDARTVTCPQGKLSTGWTPVRAEGHDKNANAQKLTGTPRRTVSLCVPTTGPVGAENLCRLGGCVRGRWWLGPVCGVWLAGPGRAGGGMIFGLWA
jgi:hypothetical protein